jgi:hypothetical protein
LKCPTEGFVTVGNTCEPCPTNCKTCFRDSKGVKTCNLCYDGFLLNDDCSPDAVQCVPCTGERDFPYGTECKINCVTDLNCIDCMNEKECAKCAKNWYVSLSKKDQCVTCLNEGNYKDRDYCKIECTSNCVVCSSSTTCSVCKVSYYLDLQGQCQTCGDNCDYCKDSTACYKCNDEAVLLPSGRCQCFEENKGWVTPAGRR